MKSFQSFSSQVSGNNSDSSDPSRVVATQASIVTLPIVAGRVKGALPDLTTSADALRRATSVETALNSDILSISSRASNERDAVRIANAFAQEFVVYRGQLDTEGLNGAIADIQSRLDDLGARGEDTSDFYRQLQRTQEDLRTRAVLGTRNASVVQPAAEAVQIAPRPVRSAIVTFAAAVLALVVLVWLMESADRKVRRESDIAGVGLDPVLAAIPHIDPAPSGSASTVEMLTNPGSPAAETYRLLASVLDMTNVGGGSRVILVTSAAAAEGKTTTTLNLGVALARAGHRVVICEFDLRAPTVARRVPLDPHRGVTTVLTGAAELSYALQHVPLQVQGAQIPTAATAGSLSVLTSGPLPPNPADFVLAPGVKAMMTQLRKNHDVVLIDSPPWLRVSDGAALARNADSILCVARLRQTSRMSLERLGHSLRSIGVPVIGLVLTDRELSRRDRADYGYGYGPERDLTDRGSQQTLSSPASSHSDGAHSGVPDRA